MPAEIARRFFETTRGQVLALLRRGPRTVEELARELGLTDNAIRAHLTTLERDGFVRQEGQRRGPGAGKPALVYEVDPQVEVRLSRAYAPVLTALVDELVKDLPKDRTDSLLRRAGAQLAGAISRPGGTLEERVRQAVALLNEPVGPTDEDVREFMSGNICRCGAYQNIVAAIQQVRRSQSGKA